MSVVASTTYGDSYVRFVYTMTERNTAEEASFDYKVRWGESNHWV